MHCTALQDTAMHCNTCAEQVLRYGRLNQLVPAFYSVYTAREAYRTLRDKDKTFRTRQLTQNIPNWPYYLQLGISIPQLGDNISNWILMVSEAENK